MNQKEITTLYEDYYGRGDWGTGQVKGICKLVLNQYWKRNALMPHSILDVGCGCGHYTNEFHRNLKDAYVVGIDVSSNAIEKALELYGNKARRLMFVVDDASKMGSSGCFDLIFIKGCSLLNKKHFDDSEVKAFIADMRNRLHDGGLLVIVERTDLSARIPSGAGWHCRSMAEMETLFDGGEIVFFVGDKVLDKHTGGFVDYMVVYEGA